MISLKTNPIRRGRMGGNLFTEINKATEIKTNIETTDQEIEQMVYALYELTEEEIKIVEGVIKKNRKY